MGKYSKLGKNTIIIFLGNIGAKMISILMLPLYTRWLSQADFGTTDMITVYVSFLISLATFCISESIFIFPKDASFIDKQKYYTTGILFIITSLIASVIVLNIIKKILIYHEFNNTFTQYTDLICILLISMAIQQYSQQFTRSIDKMKIYSTTGIILTSCTALFSFIFIPQYGVFGYAYSISLANLISAIYSFTASRSFKYIRLKMISKEKGYQMLKYSIPLIPNALMWWTVTGINRPILESYANMNAIGIIAVANKFPNILFTAFYVFVTSWQISVIEEFGKKDYNIFYNKIFKLTIIILFFIFISIATFSKILIKLLAGPEFYEAWTYIPILTFGTIFNCIAGFCGTNFSATKESKYFFYSSLWGAISAIICNLLLIPTLSIWGACLATCISFASMAIARIIYSMRYVKITNTKDYLTLFFISIAIIICNLYIENFTTNLIVYLALTFCIFLKNKRQIKTTFRTLKNNYGFKFYY